MTTKPKCTPRAPLIPLIAVLAVLPACGRKPAAPAGSRAPTPTQADSTALATGAATGGAAGRDTTRGELLPTIVAGGRAADSAALAPLTLTFAAIGYRTGVVLVGTAAEATITIPVDDGLRPAELRLRLIPTPRMPPATLILRQRDQVLAQRDLTDTTSSITLPLANTVVQDGQAIVEVALSVPGRDLCEAEMFYRTVLTPASQVSFTGTPRPVSAINAFFQPWVERVTFYVADRPSGDAAQSVLDAAAYVARRYRGMATVFEVKPLPPAGTPVPEPGPWARAVVWSPTGGTQILHIDNGRGTVLAIAARRDARQLFTLPDGDELVAAPGFRTSTVDLARGAAAATTLRTFADLGFDSRTIQGNSLVATSYPVSLADLGTPTTPTALRLVVRHSILPAAGSGSLRLHLNGNLIYSRPLEHDGFDAVIPIPAHVLRRDNVFDVRFQVTLGEGGCLVGGPVFTATIDNASAFVTNGTSPLAPGFGRFPQAFVPAFSVLLDPLDRYRVDLAATMIGAMQQTTRTPLAPALARDLASATGPLLAVGTSALAGELDAPLHSDGVRLRDVNGRVWDDFAPDAPYGAMQGWVRDGNDVLLLHHTGANGQPLADLVHDVLAPYGWFGLRGDLAIRGTEGPVRTLTVANGGWRLEAEPAGPGNVFERFWNPFWATAAVLLIILLIWLYPRVVRHELDTTG